MTIVKGQIESLKRIKAELLNQGISRFNSIQDINIFLSGYEAERQAIARKADEELDLRIEALKVEKEDLKKAYALLEEKSTLELQNKIDTLSSTLSALHAKETNFIATAVNSFRILSLESQKKHLQKNFQKILFDQTAGIAQKLENTIHELKECSNNRQEVLQEHCRSRYSELDKVKQTVDSLYTFIAGAVGEGKVVNELEKLSDEHVLFNDYFIKFDTPIYNKKEDEKIFSIQIDHLLVSPAGVFIIETKNWSDESLRNLSLRSPVQQIRRTSFALFVLLNNSKSASDIALKNHHWGERRIPIKRLIVMINNKPKGEFKHVHIKTLHELNNYVSYLEPVFDTEEVQSISAYLEGLQGPPENDLPFNTPRTSVFRQSSVQTGSTSRYQPSLNTWLKKNPGKGVNDYYSRYS